MKNLFKKIWLVIKLITPLAFKFWLKEFKEEWNKV